MNEEEKKLVEKFKNLYIKDFNGEPITVDDRLSYIECALITNLIKKLDKELNNLKEIEQAHKTDNGLLRQELDMQIEHNKELEATLKQTQNSWFEDTQKLEQEKEKNNELEIELSTRDNINVDKLVEKYRYYRRLADSYQANCISKDKLKEIVDEHIPKQPNIITGEIEYTPNANANSFLVQDILKLLEEK